MDMLCIPSFTIVGVQLSPFFVADSFPLLLLLPSRVYTAAVLRETESFGTNLWAPARAHCGYRPEIEDVVNIFCWCVAVFVDYFCCRPF